MDRANSTPTAAGDDQSDGRETGQGQPDLVDAVLSEGRWCTENDRPDQPAIIGHRSRRHCERHPFIGGELAGGLAGQTPLRQSSPLPHHVVIGIPARGGHRLPRRSHHGHLTAGPGLIAGHHTRQHPGLPILHVANRDRGESIGLALHLTDRQIPLETLGEHSQRDFQDQQNQDRDRQVGQHQTTGHPLSGSPS